MGIYDELAKLDEQFPTPKVVKTREGKRRNAVPKRIEKSSNRDVTQSSSQAIMKERKHDIIVEHIRKSLRLFGKEQTTHRLTPEEKRALLDIVYTYKSRGITTSENEVARIAINLLVNDYRENGENSILEKVLKALKE